MSAGSDAIPVPRITANSRSLAVILAASLETAIVSGEYPPGHRLPPERELAEQLQVSRTTLREAMKELEAKRLVERRPGRGTVVLAPRHEVDELMRGLSMLEQGLANVSELRALIEPGIAGHAAARARPSNILRLEDTLARSSEFLAPTESLRLDIEFHVLLAHGAQNPLLSTILEISNGWARDVRLDSHRTRAARRSSIRGHRQILERVREHDVAGAREAMAAHLADVRVLIAESLTEPRVAEDEPEGPGPE